MTIKKLSQQIENTAHQFEVSDLDNAYRSLEKIQNDLNTLVRQTAMDKPDFCTFLGWFIYFQALVENAELDDAHWEAGKLLTALGSYLDDKDMANGAFRPRETEERAVEFFKKEVRKKKKAAGHDTNQTPAA